MGQKTWRCVNVGPSGKDVTPSHGWSMKDNEFRKTIAVRLGPFDASVVEVLADLPNLYVRRLGSLGLIQIFYNDET